MCVLPLLVAPERIFQRELAFLNTFNCFSVNKSFFTFFTHFSYVVYSIYEIIKSVFLSVSRLRLISPLFRLSIVKPIYLCCSIGFDIFFSYCFFDDFFFLNTLSVFVILNLAFERCFKLHNSP